MKQITKKYLQKIFLLLLFAFSAVQIFSKEPVIYSKKVHNLSVKASYNDVDNKLIKKYAELLKLDETQINKFLSLYKFIDSWMGTRYKWGGCNRSGIDCSCFVMTLYEDVFNIKINRTTFTQFYDDDVALFRNRSQFQMGDLVFFKTNIQRETRNNKITHVGMYLANGFFIQSSSSGVNIANLNSGYWKNCFVAAGRLQDKFYKKSKLLSLPQGEVEAVKLIEAEDLENSDFEPVPYPEDLEDLKIKYAAALETDPDKINFPELFDYIDKNKYAPFNISNNCGPKENIQSCFLNKFYKEVLNLEINCELKEIISTKYTAEIKLKNKVSAFDFVLIKTNEKKSGFDVIGMYLYNDYFLHIKDNEVLISNLKNAEYTNATTEFYRIDAAILQKGYDYIKEKRKKPIAKIENSTPQNTDDKTLQSLDKPILENTITEKEEVNEPNIKTTIKEEQKIEPQPKVELKKRTIEEQAEIEYNLRKKIMEEKEVKDKADREVIAAQRAEELRIEREKIEIRKAALNKIAEEKAEEKRLAEEKVAIENAVRKRLAEEKIAEQKAAQQKLADERAEKISIANEKAAVEKLVQQKLAEEKVAAQKAAIEKAVAERVEQNKLAAEKVLLEKAEKQRIAEEKAEEKRLAEEKIKQERAERAKAAEEKAAVERLVQLKLAEDKAAQLKAAQEQKAAEKAEEKRLAEENAKAAQEERKRIADEKAENIRVEKQRIANEKAEKIRIAEEKATLERLEKQSLADEKAEQDRQEKIKIAAEEAEQKRIALEKMKAERAERKRIADEQAELLRIERKRQADERARNDSIAKRIIIDEQFEQKRKEALASDSIWKEKQRIKNEEEEAAYKAIQKAEIDKVFEEKKRIEAEKAEKKRLADEKKIKEKKPKINTTTENK